MKASSLKELIEQSSSTRQYFLSLPVEMQLSLHERNDYIHTAYELRVHAEYLNKIDLISK